MLRTCLSSERFRSDCAEVCMVFRRAGSLCFGCSSVSRHTAAVLPFGNASAVTDISELLGSLVRFRKSALVLNTVNRCLWKEASDLIYVLKGSAVELREQQSGSSNEIRAVSETTLNPTAELRLGCLSSEPPSCSAFAQFRGTRGDLEKEQFIRATAKPLERPPR
ncbi:hypothetical protein AOLI_G00013820 [Acnodon oligacanthus]